MRFKFLPVACLFLPVLLALPAKSQVAGEVLWQVPIGFSQSLLVPPPTVAPDGTVYIHQDDLFAISPAGDVLWSAAIGGAGVVGLGADGTVYAGSPNRIHAFARDGAPLWTFTESPPGAGFLAGPTVGPDGNVYVVSSCWVTCEPDEGLGAFSLSPLGSLRWNVFGFEVHGHPTPSITNREVPFGDGQLFASQDLVPGCNTTGIVAIGFDGSIDWCEAQSDYTWPTGGQDGSAYVGVVGAVSAFDSTGAVSWSQPFIQSGRPSVGPDGSVYAWEDFRALSAFNADGSERWKVEPIGALAFPWEVRVSADDRVIVFGTLYSFGQNGSIYGLEPSTGGILWEIALTGSGVGVAGPTAFSPDGRVVYVPVATFSETKLLAIQVHTRLFSDGFESGDLSGWSVVVP